MDDRRIPPSGQSSEIARRAQAMRLEAQEAISAARTTREHLLPLLQQMARADSGFLARYRASMLAAILDASMRLISADMANIQLLDAAGSLHIEAQCGFCDPFLDFFHSVHDGQAACGRAFQSRTRVVVEDVAQSTIFLGTPALEIVLDAGVRSVVSTPLVGSSGRLLGVLSVHRRTPGTPDGRNLRLLDLYAANAARSIERHMQLMLS